MSDEIYIDFYPGTHGNFLHFFCNRFLAKLPSVSPLPFNQAGASHAYKFTQPEKFIHDHYNFERFDFPESSQIISIQVNEEDLLPLQCIVLLRVGDNNIDPEHLSHNTWHKLKNAGYYDLLDNLFDNFFKNQIKTSYARVMDPSWPIVDTVNDFNNLPEHIKKECKEVHNLKLLSLGPDYPDCPESVLHEFFKHFFLSSEQHTYLIPIHYKKSCNVYRFPFNCFYNWELFSAEIKKLSKWCKMPVDINDPEVYKLHQEFISRQPYKDIKSKCDLLVQEILNNKNYILPKLNVIERGYIDSQIEKHG